MRDARRVFWNENQKALRMALAHPEQPGKAVELFREQHGMVHAAAMSARGTPTFENEVWEGLSESAARTVPSNGEHSIVWMTWHITRVEDLTMNLLIAGEEQVFTRDAWRERLQTRVVDTGNAMDAQGMASFSSSVGPGRPAGIPPGGVSGAIGSETKGSSSPAAEDSGRRRRG